MALWDRAWNEVTGAVSWLGKQAGSASEWMDNNKSDTNLIGTTLMGVGGYFAQKEANKDQMKYLREQLNLQDQMKSKYSAVPDVDTTYGNLVVDDSPNLANGGILTNIKKRVDNNQR